MKSGSKELVDALGERRPKISPLKAFGQELAKRRTFYRMSQRRLAELAGTTQKTVSQVEAGIGNHGLEILARLADVFSGEVTISFRNRHRSRRI